MADNTKIEWADATWNPLRAVRPLGLNGVDGTRVGWHCEHVSEGCRNCYAERFNERRLGTGLPYKPGHRADVQHILDEKMLLAPLRRRKPTRYFLSSMTDVFGAWVSDDQLDRLFAVMEATRQHTFMVLTKRPERMREYLSRRRNQKPIMVPIGDGTMEQHPWNNELLPPPHIWLGTSVEDQRAADERIPHLLATPAAVRFLSCEPLLGPVDLRHWIGVEPIIPGASGYTGKDSLYRQDIGGQVIDGIDWVITGGESGKGARDWPGLDDACRSLRDQCAAAGVAFFHKQMAGVRKPLRPIPPDLLIRQFPRSVANG